MIRALTLALAAIAAACGVEASYRDGMLGDMVQDGRYGRLACYRAGHAPIWAWEEDDFPVMCDAVVGDA